MTEIYRFRSIKQALGKYQELERQIIYLASPEQLNDPMEGNREIVWNHTSVTVWRLIFDRFLTWYDYQQVLDSSQLDAYNFVTRHQDPTLRALRNQELENRLLPLLSNSGRDITRPEMLMVLHFTYYQLLSATNMIDTDGFEVPWEEYFAGTWELNRRGEHSYLDEVVSGHASKIADFIINRKRRGYDQDQHEDIVEYSYLPQLYLDWIEKTLFPKYYVACFSAGYANATMWAHYADSHKGICLIFNTEYNRGERFLSGGPFELYGSRHLRKVKYHAEVRPLNALAMLGELDDYRNRMALPSGARVWPPGYLAKFRNIIVTKSTDWQRENEYRIILENAQEDRGQPESATLQSEREVHYNFETLKGIIFGVNTEDKVKIEIMKLVERKCAKEIRSDFKFYQAYLERGVVKIYEVGL